MLLTLWQMKSAHPFDLERCFNQRGTFLFRVKHVHYLSPRAVRLSRSEFSFSTVHNFLKEFKGH